MSNWIESRSTGENFLPGNTGQSQWLPWLFCYIFMLSISVLYIYTHKPGLFSTLEREASFAMSSNQRGDAWQVTSWGSVTEYLASSTTAQETLERRRQIECKRQRIGIVLWKSVFWTWHSYHIHEPTEAMVISTRLSQEQASQDSDTD